MSTINEQKNELRQNILKSRRMFSKTLIAEKSNTIAEKFLNWSLYQQSDSVMLYLAMSDEPQLDRLIEQMFESGKRVYIPFLYNEWGKMDAAQIFGFDDIVVGKMNLRTPNPERLKIIDPTDIDLVIVPGVAFDIRGVRLGMGAGYYDRFLSKATNAVKIGVTWDKTIVDCLPSATHDISMDYLMSEERFIAIKRGKI